MQSYFLFRLSLLPRPQKDLLESGKADPSREEWLRKVLNEEWKFGHYGGTFHYVPAPDQSSSEAVLGRVGRSIIVEENRPPEEGLEESLHEGWKAAVVVIDPRHHEDGQKLAFEFDRQVGKPIPLISALFSAINEAYPRAAYYIEVQPIFDADTFWQFAEKNKGEITSLTFEFVAPNMFGGHDSIQDELRDFRNIEKAREVSITIKSADGIETDTDRVKEGVDYAMKGGGRIRARARGKKHYSSVEKTRTVVVEGDEHGSEPMLVKAARRIARILGRE